ncbi:MAG TPA: MmcQ/YjbR family DNA-binding protein, partial [Patescibacteria group bacterium]|nr:MmcQ/YjbR family DNA-binding protein [Patescibacteria group bacterium]
MTLDELKKLLISLDKVKYDHKFAKNISTYYNCSVSKDKTSSNMFALIYDDRVPLKISLRCDPQL